MIGIYFLLLLQLWFQKVVSHHRIKRESGAPVQGNSGAVPAAVSPLNCFLNSVPLTLGTGMGRLKKQDKPEELP